jgi:tetratricopeptide (TPR) repeat protein/SAM-dependent methyltransferase
LDEAVACYRQMLALEPNLAAAHLNLGNALWALGDHEKAEASYRRALSLQPDLVNAHNNLGTVLLERNGLDEAVACYRKALALAPDYAEALNNLGAALCRQGKLDEGEASIRRALALKPDLAGAHDNLAVVLWEKAEHSQAEASARRALALAPDFAQGMRNLGAMLSDQGRWDEAVSVYRRFLQIRPRNGDALNGLARALAAKGDVEHALATIAQSLKIEETADAKRIFADIVKPLRWTSDSDDARLMLARALIEPWARPAELAASAASLIKQRAHTGSCVARAARAWPRQLSAEECFGADGLAMLAGDRLLLALLVSAQNTDIELERFLTLARRLLLDAAEGGASEAVLEFPAALARQCFINEYVFFHDDREIRRARNFRNALADALENRTPIPSLTLLAVAAYFPLHTLPGAGRLLEKTWPAPVDDVLVQQVREPQREAALRITIPQLAPVKDAVSRLVQNQYEENPYPRWVRMPRAATTETIAGYLRRKFPLVGLAHNGGGERAEVLSAGCGTGQFPLGLAQGVNARVLAVDLSLSSLSYAKRKAGELGLTEIEFAQGDLLELAKIGRSFDVIECSGVLHHLADPIAGWRTLLSLLRPGGFMLVGLYSQLARRGVVEARRFIAERNYGPSADDIRRCRQDLLATDRSGKLGTDFGDFFGLSSCRDLLFHVQERRMRLAEIAAFLDEHGLRFLGFERDAAAMRAYKRRFRDDPAAANLAHWDAFENDHPDTFSGMYVFWIQKSAETPA